jgi:3-hydroxyisobutyrate dehydrogenase
MSVKVGVVGLGNMGGSMALCLVDAGHDVLGYDPVPNATARLVDGGGRVAPTPAAVAAETRVVICSLPDAPAVRAAVLGPDGVLDGADRGTTIIETSTIDPETIREVADACEKHDVDVLDAACSGQPPQARSGELTFFLGGPDALIERHRPLLETLTKLTHHTGPVGSAKTVKLVNNLMALGNMAVAAEAFALGIRSGLDAQRLYDILSTTGGRSHHFNYDYPRVIEGDFTPGFRTALALKDIRIVLEMAAQEDHRVVLAPVI